MSNQHGAGGPRLGTRDELALSTPAPASTWHDTEWQRLWLAIESRPWSSLALIPGGEGAPPNFTLIVAVALSRTGMVHVGSPIQVADATRVPLNQLTPFLGELRRCTANGERVLVALPPATTSPITSAIAQSLDAAVLCILLERMLSSQAKRTVKQLGAARFLGSAIFHPNQLDGLK